MSDYWNSPFNPFNSQKILLWRKYLEHCARYNYLVPPMVDIDPSKACNYKCPHCNAWQIIENNKDSNLSEKHLIKLADFLRDWRQEGRKERVLSCCVSGGGEPLLNPAIYNFIERLVNNGIETGLITNGSLLTKKEDIELIAKHCSWVGFSMDASTKETYAKVKGISSDIFTLVCENLQKLAKQAREKSSINRVCFKFLLTPDNYTEIYEAVKLAKSLGVHDFHLRPVGISGIKAIQGILFTPEMLKSIDKQMAEAMKLQTKDFNVFGIKHKFTPNFMPKKEFSKCWCIPMLPTFSADGNVYYCFDLRGRKDLVMCKHFEIEEFWNTQKHKNMVKNFDVHKDCPVRCTFSTYNQAVEEVIIKDNMYRNFL